MASLRGMPKIIRISFVVLLVCGFLAITGAAQTQSPQARTKKNPAQELLQHEVTVTLKLVQAYVVDPAGNPARDLEISDFILYDSGKRQDITEFEKHFLPVPGVSLEETKPAPVRHLPSLLNRKFIFIIDYEGNDLEAVAKSRKAILHFMDTQVKEGDEIALFSFSETRGLVLHEFLTAEHQKVRAALQKAMDVPGIPGGWDFERVILEAETVGQTSAATGSFGQRPALMFGGSGPQSSSLALARHLQELASSSSPVFSVDTATGSAKAKVFADGSLEYLSALTGGKFYHNVNYESKIAEDIQATTSNYYVLGYSVASDRDGKFHEIKVEVQKPGYKVYAQKGYFSPLPFPKLSAVEKHLHLLGLALGEKTNPDRRLDFPMTVLPFSPDAEFNAVLIAEIPVQRIRGAIGDDTELISLVFDQDRTVADSKRETINWEANDRRKAYYYSFLSLPPGSYDCRLVIRNLETGAGALASGTANVPERKEKGLQLFPPLLVTLEHNALYLKQAAPNKGIVNAAAVSLSDVFSIDSNAYAPRLEKVLSAGSEVWAAVRCALIGGSAGGARLAAYLIDEMTGEKVALPLTIMKVYSSHLTLFTAVSISLDLAATPVDVFSH